jgi:Ca2+-binding EF-hand superfamily protein
MGDDEIDQIFDTADADGNGYLEFNEFVAATMDHQKILSNENLQRAFDNFDTDGSGSISAEELKVAFSFGKGGALDEACQ